MARTTWRHGEGEPGGAEGYLRSGQPLGLVLDEQMTTGVEAMRSLAECDSWDEALKVQNEFTRASLERVCSRTLKSAEVTSALITNSFVPLQQSARRAADRIHRPAA